MEYFPRILVIADSSEKYRMICEHGISNLKSSQTDGFCISNSEKVKDYKKRFPQGHWTFLGLGSAMLGLKLSRDDGKTRLTQSQ